MEINIIVAYDQNQVIGYLNKIPWNIPNDLKHFKKITIGYPIIMGKNTWESIGHPLEGRMNIVLTSSTKQNYLDSNNLVFTKNLDTASNFFKNYEKIFIIGGEKIYKTFLDKAKKIFATEIHHKFVGDKFFPRISPYEWKEIERVAQNIENNFKYDFVIYRRI